MAHTSKHRISQQTAEPVDVRRAQAFGQITERARERLGDEADDALRIRHGRGPNVQRLHRANVEFAAAGGALTEEEELASIWGIDRDASFEFDSISNTTSQGMTLNEFVTEWADNVDRAPTQDEYERWIQWGNPGQIRAEANPDSKARFDLSLSVLTGDETTEGTFDAYTAEDLVSLNAPFDFQNDGEYVLLPNSVAVADRYIPVTEGEGATLYFKQEKTDWYESPFIAALAGLAGTILTGGLAAAGAASLIGGTAVAAGATVTGLSAATSLAVNATVGAIAGGAGAGIAAETLGGDFWEGAERGVVAGAFSGAVNSALQREQFGSVQRAGIRGEEDTVIEFGTTDPYPRIIGIFRQ